VPSGGAVRVNRVYDRLTIQGEGPYAGARCTFVRLWGCNLHCSWCDSAETWDVRGRIGEPYPALENETDMTVHDVARAVGELDVDLCVVTGGEPLLQPAEVTALARTLDGIGIATHVETNGTRPPGPDLVGAIEHFVVSPKLPSADAGPSPKPETLRAWAALGWRRASFKFVVLGPEDLGHARQLCDLAGVERRARWVMPEGVSAGRVADGLAALTEQALSAGFSVSSRAHVMLWGDERGR
jgi:7-carboxy-7-deazaguanine synthase